MKEMFLLGEVLEETCPKNLLVSNYSQIYNYFEFTESRNLFLSASMLDGWRIIEGTTTVEPTYPGRNHSCFHLQGFMQSFPFPYLDTG